MKKVHSAKIFFCRFASPLFCELTMMKHEIFILPNIVGLVGWCDGPG